MAAADPIFIVKPLRLESTPLWKSCPNSRPDCKPVGTIHVSYSIADSPVSRNGRRAGRRRRRGITPPEGFGGVALMVGLWVSARDYEFEGSGFGADSSAIQLP